MRNKGDIAAKIKGSIAERKKINSKIANGFARLAQNMRPAEAERLLETRLEAAHKRLFEAREEVHNLRIERMKLRGEHVPPLASATPQPPPKGDGDPILPMVLADINARAEMGFKKYGTLLRTNNGRDALMDALQEAIDLVMYLRQAIAERDGE